jgi:hypothetical protein
MKPSERIKHTAQQFLEQSFPQPHSERQVAGAVSKFVLEYLDEVEIRIAKLEALNPEVRDVIGTTVSGATVHGLRRYDPESED